MKKRILIVGDSARLNTGYATVIRHIGNTLVGSGEDFEIAQLGTQNQSCVIDNNVQNKPRFTIYTPRFNTLDPTKDRYGKETFDKIILEFRPHIVISVGDPWIVSYIGSSKYRHLYKWVIYIAIDGENYPSKLYWYRGVLDIKNIISSADYIIPFTDFGISVLKSIGIEPTLKINHGVDKDIFRKLLKSKSTIRGKFFEAPPFVSLDDAIIFTFVGRNQFRKNLGQLIQIWKVFKEKYDKDNRCLLYFHTPSDDIKRGYNIVEILLYLGVDESIILNPYLTQTAGVSEQILNEIYNASDCMVSATTGEGWCLPLGEAQAAGTPSIVTGYSGHTEFIKDGEHGYLVPIAMKMFEVGTSFIRGYPDTEAFAALMGKFISLSHEEREAISLACIENSEKYSWDFVNQSWIDLVNEIDVSDYSLDSDSIGLKPQETIMFDKNGHVSIISSPIDIDKDTEVAYVSTYNEKCGIATYTSNLKEAYGNVVGKNAGIFSELQDIDTLMYQIVNSGVDIVHWQHEPGIMPSGTELMNLIRNIKMKNKNIINVFTLHTKNDELIKNIDGLADHIIIHDTVGGSPHTSYTNYSVINHAIMNYEIQDKEEMKKRLGLGGKFVVGTTGFLTPSKGLELIFRECIPLLKKREDIVFYFLNALHGKDAMRLKGEGIKKAILDLAASEGVSEKVIVDTDFYDKEEMSKRIQSFDVGFSFIPGNTKSQSGSIAEMVGNRVPVICSKSTHFGHVIGKGMVIPYDDKQNAVVFARFLVRSFLSKNYNIVINQVRRQIDAELPSCSYEVFAEQHIKIYEMLKARRDRHGGKRSTKKK